MRAIQIVVSHAKSYTWDGAPAEVFCDGKAKSWDKVAQWSDNLQDG